MSESFSLDSVEQAINITNSTLNGVQIGGIAGGDLSVTQIQGGVYIITVNNDIGVDSKPVQSVVQPKTRIEYKAIKLLQSDVQKNWIQGTLNASLHNQAILDLGLENFTNTVPNSSNKNREIFTEINQLLSTINTDKSILENEKIGTGRTLLILGEPGSGKTTTLLKLADSLIKKSEKDESQPIPVILNLSNFGKESNIFNFLNKKNQNISNWLIQEITIKYKYKKYKKTIKNLIDQEELIIMLDGLDEVEQKHRNNCVKELNKFIQEYRITELVICCRINTYKELSEKLCLHSVIYVQPLSLDQINHYLNQAGEKLNSLKIVIQSSIEMQKFASSPLILSIMSLAYKEHLADELIQIQSDKLRLNHIFNTYIDQMFLLRKNTKKYPKEKAIHYLIWIAQHMKESSENIFFIDSINMSFNENVSVFIDGIIGGTIGMSIGGIIGISIGKLIGIPIYGLIFGLVSGIVSGFFLGPINISLKAFIGALPSALISGLTSGLIGMLTSGVTGGVTSGLIGMLVGGVTGGLIGILIGGLDIRLYLIDNIVKKFTICFTMLCFFSIVTISPIFILFIFNIPIFNINLIRLYIRFRFYRMGYMPWRYSRFLDYSVEHLFLQKVNGGYIFVHRMLLEHFAEMEPPLGVIDHNITMIF